MAAVGDCAFVYRPLKGISWLIKIEQLFDPSQSQPFCNSFAMATARVRILEVFDPPISAKVLKSNPVSRAEPFVGRNFQLKAFRIRSPQTTEAILSLRR